MGQPSPALQGDTFLRAPRASAADLSHGDIAVVGVPHEITKMSRGGTAQGPRAIREATIMVDWEGEFGGAEQYGDGLVDLETGRAYRYRREHIYDLGDVVVGPDLSVNRARINELIGAISRAGALPLVLGGDHYLTYPSASAVMAAHDKRLALLSVDMHLDLADVVPEFGAHNGATHLRRLVRDGFVDPARVVIFGVESLVAREEWQFAQAHGIQIVPAQRVLAEGVENTLRPVLERALDGSDGIYVTLDIDAGARSLVPGTGNHTGVIGLTPDHLLQVASIVSELPWRGLDLSEVSPPLDPSGATTGLAAAMLLRVLDPLLYHRIDAWPD
jgi:agmatinase